MSEKRQGTACQMHQKMLHRYNDELHHKHDKNHFQFRKHFKSHPVQAVNDQEHEMAFEPTGQVRVFKLRKLRKRLDKGHIH